VFLCINALDHNCTILHRISHRLFSVFQLNFNDLAFIDGNYLASDNGNGSCTVLMADDDNNQEEMK
ncbi:hypothetical protein, partial [Thiolapillus sp.]|uniref:hypothetical protein n=1 Tax=Thiolapillus sp. TaxID=2017437 RepID=UPI003AF4E71B